MKNKYCVYKSTRTRGDGGPGRYVDPDTWITGPDPVRHDKYYGYLKHRAQAKFRKEEYQLTWEDWEAYWPHHKWQCRGRKKTDLCLMRIDITQPWSVENCEVAERMKYLKRQQEYRDA